MAREPKPQKVLLITCTTWVSGVTLAYVKSMPEGGPHLHRRIQEKELVEEACKGLPYNVTVRLIGDRGRDVSAPGGLQDII